VPNGQVLVLYGQCGGFVSVLQGIMGDDRHLAGSVWRVLYLNRPDIDPRHLEIVVHYIRKQVRPKRNYQFSPFKIHAELFHIDIYHVNKKY